MRTTRMAIVFAAAAVLAAALSGCSGGSSSSPYGSSDQSSGSSSESSAPAASKTSLMTASTSLGEIIIDGKGMTAYMFTKDTKGATTSACTGGCATAWPAITTTSDAPKVDGVTGEVGMIDAIGGGKQVTVNGWPLYTYAADSAPGDVTGQGVNEVWYVLTPAGEPIMK